jgi:hypothetical protein
VQNVAPSGQISLPPVFSAPQEAFSNAATLIE